MSSVTAKANTEQLKKVLKGAVNKQGEGNLEEHLQKLFNFLILHYPGQAIEKFEEASYLIKHNMPLDQFMRIKDDRDYHQLVKDLEGYTGTMQKIFAKPVPEDENEPPEEPPAVAFVADLNALSRQWQWAGIGFGEQETYRLQKSLKKLAAAVSPVSLRFFGKITGTEKDYYIVEAEIEDGGEEEAQEQEADFDPVLNKFKYFVASDSLSEWTKLPDQSPSHMKGARNIKYLFTGDLERQIFTNPFFFGREKDYLRAQISRIYQATQLTWKGLMRPVEESEDRSIEVNTNDEAEDPNPKAPALSQMASLDMWVHLKKNILKNGTTLLKAPEPLPDAEEPSEEEAKEALDKLMKEDPYADLLAPISSDRKIQVTKTLQQPAWTVNVMGDSTEYNGKSHGVAVVRSLQWPGAYSFYTHGGEVESIYVGNGHKYEQNATFYPVEPPTIIADPQEYEGPKEPDQNPPEPVEAPAEEEGPIDGEQDD